MNDSMAGPSSASAVPMDRAASAAPENSSVRVDWKPALFITSATERMFDARTESPPIPAASAASPMALKIPTAEPRMDQASLNA